MRYTLFTLLLLFLLPLTGIAQKKAPFTTYPGDPIGVKETVLDNGLRVILIEDHNQPRIFGSVAVRAGGKYDPKDATGMGHYLEHMLFKGTQTMGTTDYNKEKPYLDQIDLLYEKLGQTKEPEARKTIQKEINDNAIAAAEYALPNELDRMLAGIGSQGVNAFTTEEVIVYHNTFPPNQVEKWLDIYSERFIKPVFRLFQSELETVYEEKNRSMDSFIFALFEKFNENLFKNHPYGQQTVIGTSSHLKNPSLVKMYEYFDQYYVSNNMALVLSGDFDATVVLPLIQEKFGRLKRGIVPIFPEYKEEPFDGRELVVGRYTPVGAALMGFRTVPIGHPDGPALDIANYLLANEGQTGLLDKLTLDQKVLVAQMMPLQYTDHGAAMFIVVPKIIGQSVKKAEKLVLAEMAKLRAGQIENAQLSAAKLNLKKEFSRNMENLQAKAIAVTDAFVSGQSWDEIIRYPAQIDQVDLARVSAVAEKYYGSNYLILQSKMGFPKKEKLNKPPYAPPIPKSESKSAYAQYFDQLPARKPEARFVDLDKDIDQVQLGTNAHLYRVNNPINDIFQLQFRYGIGTNRDQILDYVAEYMPLLGTETQSTSALKQAFNAVGCTYRFDASDNYFTVTLEGMEDHLKDGLELLQTFVSEAKPDQEKVKIIANDARTIRKLERKSVQDIGTALFAYVRRGEKSSQKRRLSVKAIRKLDAETLVSRFNDAREYSVEVHYTGTRSANDIADILRDTYFKDDYPANKANYLSILNRSYDEPQIIFLDRKDAIQSQVYFYQESESYDKNNIWLNNAFNEYFGSGMSSLVFQEIREFRSLAYSARASIVTPSLPGENNYLSGFIGCQADKTAEALAVMTDLIQNMPAKPERIAGIRDAVTQSAYSARPGFRYLSRNMLIWQRKGYEDDPSKLHLAQYGDLNWERLQTYYQSALGAGSTNPLIIAITGDSKRIDMEALKKYGKFVEVKESDIMTK